MLLKQYIEKCLDGQSLTVDEASRALELIMTGQATDVQIAGLLIALRAKGETIDELVGFARTMRAKSVEAKIEDPDAIDMCGTGGDGLGTFNISTVSSLVAAGAGATVAKHGNKSVSSQSGSADVLSALGVNIQCPAERVAACVNTVGFGFFFAPMFHPAMKFAAKPRTELGVKSIFNMVGPLTNPAGVRRQLIGTYHQNVAEKVSGALRNLDVDTACVVHSADGMDEVTLSGDTNVLEVRGTNGIQQYSLSPESFGFSSQPLSSMQGGNKDDNAAIALRVLKGEKGPARDVVISNAALGLYVSGKVRDVAEGSAAATEAIESGRALGKLNKLIEFTNRA
jgi:anthranilate phosphoribosyltransferase